MSNTIYTDAMRAKGAADAADFQQRSAEMDGTAMYAEEEKIPDFSEAVKVKNMLERPWGQDNGFICRSKVGHVVRLIQPYDSDIYTQEPEDAALAAHWRFVYSTDLSLFWTVRRTCPKAIIAWMNVALGRDMCGDRIWLQMCTRRRHIQQDGQTLVQSRTSWGAE